MHTLAELYIGSKRKIVHIIDSILEQKLFHAVIEKENKITGLENNFALFMALSQQKSPHILNNMYELINYVKILLLSLKEN